MQDDDVFERSERKVVPVSTEVNLPPLPFLPSSNEDRIRMVRWGTELVLAERERAAHVASDMDVVFPSPIAAAISQGQEPEEGVVDNIVAELVAGLRRAEEKRQQELSELPPGTCETCMGEGYLGSIESQRITDCPDCTGGMKNG